MENKPEVITKLDESIALAFSSNKLKGFEKAQILSQAMQSLKELITPDYMKSIMPLQGNKLGFKTDKDSEGGYSESVVKSCLIEAVLTGVQVVGNQFNIIAGNCYITKEGFGYLLKNYPGLWWEITPKLPRVNADNSSAAITMVIEWTTDGTEKKTREIDFPIKMNKYMGVDAVIGKATRKARAWLYNTVTGNEISDGDVQDINSEVVGSKLNTPAPEVIKSDKTGA
jgi:hypothetical protein